MMEMSTPSARGTRSERDLKGDTTVDDLKVRIVHLDPMRVASATGYGESPEPLAWDKLAAWAGPKGLLGRLDQHRIFGFNNPNPSPGSPEYGYEFWITVGPDMGAEGDVEIKEVPGGVFAVTSCEPRIGEDITATWQQLAQWLMNSEHQPAHEQWLEEHIWPSGGPFDFGTLRLDLFAPIAE
jgi:DNA gyrase inhibitor GyrI